MAENIRELVEGAPTRTDNVSILRMIRNQVRSLHADATRLSTRRYDTEEEAVDAMQPIIEDFQQNYHLDVAEAVEALVRVSGKGVRVPNVSVNSYENEDEVGISVSSNKETSLTELDMFDTKNGKIRGAIGYRTETPEGYQPIIALIVEQEEKMRVNINFSDSQIPMVAGWFITQFLAELTEDTQIEYPAVEEFERYEAAVMTIAKKSVVKKRFFDQVHRIKSALFSEEYYTYKELRSLPTLRWIARRCEDLVKAQEGQDAPICTEEEVSELLLTLIHRGRMLALEGDVLDGRSDVECSGTVVDVFMQHTDVDICTPVIALESKDDEGTPYTESFIVKNLNSLVF